MSDGLCSGQLGNPRFEVEVLPAYGTPKWAVRVQLTATGAETLVRWHRPDIGNAPLAEVPEFGDSDAYCDAVIAAVRAWAATFPVA